MITEHGDFRGIVEWELRTEDGALKASGESLNLLTQVGDQMYAERGAGITTLATPTGTKLGIGTTAVAKTGAGAGIVSYLTASNHAFDATPVSSLLAGGQRRVAYTVTYAAGQATTASAINEIVMVNETIATNAAGAGASATIARALLAGVPSKAAGESLTFVWNHELIGS